MTTRHVDLETLGDHDAWLEPDGPDLSEIRRMRRAASRPFTVLGYAFTLLFLAIVVYDIVRGALGATKLTRFGHLWYDLAPESFIALLTRHDRGAGLLDALALALASFPAAALCAVFALAFALASAMIHKDRYYRPR